MNELIGQIIYEMIVHYKVTIAVFLAILVIGYTYVGFAYYREIKEWKEWHEWRDSHERH